MAQHNLTVNDNKATVESDSDFKGNTKLKLLRLLEILQSESTQQKPLSTSQICQRLEKMGMHCERRTLYRDIKLLIDCGYDIGIVTERNANLYYYKKATELSFSELKILIDAAKAASFITQEQTEELVRKLVALGGSRKKELLSSNMVFFNSHKHSNTDVYDVVSTIEAAIQNKTRISFFYFDLDEHAERVYRHNKKEYLVDPIVLIFNNDNYYLRGYTADHDEIRNTSYEIRVPDKKKFLDAVAKTISKHTIASYYEPSVISPRPAGIPALKGELSKFTVGAKVNHTGFGNGTILQIKSLNGSHIIDVKFDKGGARKLLLEMVVRSGMLQLVTEDTAEPVEPEKPAKDPKQEQYELGYEDVKELFTQQTRIIRDRYKTRWVMCEKCGKIKQDVEFASYGGHRHVNLGICRDCSRKDQG